MSRYRVELIPAAQRQFRKLSRDAAKRLKPALLSLGDDPRPPGTERLSGKLNIWRIRVEDYRILYTIEDEVLLVLVVKIGHRRDVYRR